MTVDDVIRRMENGEPLRWISKGEVDRQREGNNGTREFWIGGTLIRPAYLVFAVMCDPRVRELPGNEYNDQPYVDYELV